MKRIVTSLVAVCIMSTLAHTKVAFADLKDGLVAYYPYKSGIGNNSTVNRAPAGRFQTRAKYHN